MKKLIYVLGFSVGMIILLLNIWVYYQTNYVLPDSISANNKIAFENLQFREYLSALKDVETGQRGYLITGDKIYLEPYERSRAFIQSPQIQSLLDNYEMSPSFGEEVSKLRKLTTLKLDGLQEVINKYNDSGFQSAKEMVITNRGKDQMDNIRVILAKIQFELQNRLSPFDDQVRLKSFFDIMILINIFYILFINILLYLQYKRSLVHISKN